MNFHDFPVEWHDLQEPALCFAGRSWQVAQFDEDAGCLNVADDQERVGEWQAAQPLPFGCIFDAGAEWHDEQLLDCGCEKAHDFVDEWQVVQDLSEWPEGFSWQEAQSAFLPGCENSHFAGVRWQEEHSPVRCSAGVV